MKVDIQKLKKYEDMLSMECPQSAHHKPMEREKRAAQFASFSALTGYGDAIDNTIQDVQKKWEDEYEIKAGKQE